MAILPGGDVVQRRQLILAISAILRKPDPRFGIGIRRIDLISDYEVIAETEMIKAQCFRFLGYR